MSIMEEKIIILTGEPGSGKTTAIINWINKSNIRAHGVLMPDFNGKRHFYNPYMDVAVPVEAENKAKGPDPDTIYRVGSQTFSKQAYRVASSWLKMKPPLNTDYYIIDGVGPLEMANEGLEPELSPVIESALKGAFTHVLILVIAKPLLSKLKRKYGLSNVKVIEQEGLAEFD
ncbi:MAG: hypothetical protein EA409_03100 [Saprospirales bacterium]|nr:MAG: hypothetical protein EA409_03100 [Saprospirales bacterium]